MGRAATRRTDEEISAIMRRVSSKDTTPEVLLRKALWAKGLRYRISPEELPGKPDVVLPAHGLAVFIDGDLWHGNQWARRGLTSLEEQFRETKSREYWLKKIRRNMERDCRVTAALMSQGWTVLRFWESRIHEDLEGCVREILDAVGKKTARSSASLLPEKTFIEFFAGIGLMRAGLEAQGWSISLANDIDPRKREMYEANFGDAGEHFVLADIHELHERREIPAATLVTASFPCNDLSLAGARAGLKGSQSSAFWGVVNVLRRMKSERPPLVLLENVTGFLTSHRGADFRAALQSLNELGYAVDAFILDAANFVPQSRRRLFVVGVLKEVRSENFGMTRDARLIERDARPKALAEFITKNSDIDWSIRSLPAQPRRASRLEDVLEDLHEDAPEWWSAERASYLLGQMSPRHRAEAERMIEGGEWSYGTVFRRMRGGRSTAELRRDGVAGCLRTPRGGSGRQILFKAGGGRYFARLVTPREAARLMGAGDYTINVPANQALFGFGDAVCVPVIEWIAKYYLNPLVNELIRGRALSGARA
jgi:DNA (cytosine-5)-methyltransferase 1